MKQLTILVLLVLLVGCGKSEQQQSEQSNQEVPAASAQNNAKLTLCPDCEGKVSKRAATCPHCGAPLNVRQLSSNAQEVKTADSESEIHGRFNEENSPSGDAPATPGNSVAHPYVIHGLQAVVIIHPRSTYESKLLQRLILIKPYLDKLIEETNQEFKLNLREIERISLLVKDLPRGSREIPSIAMVLEVTKAANHRAMVSMMTGVRNPVQHEGMKWYIGDDTDLIGCEVNDKTIVIGTQLDLVKQLIVAPAANSPLNKRLVELDYSNQHFVAVGNSDMLQGLMTELQKELFASNAATVGQSANEGLSLALSEIMDKIGQLKAVSVVLNLSSDFHLLVGVVAANEESAATLQAIASDSLANLKVILDLVTREFEKDSSQPDEQLLQPILEEASRQLTRIKPQRAGKKLKLTVNIPASTLASFQLVFIEYLKQTSAPFIHSLF